MNRKDILELASSAVHAMDMDHDYGKPEDNFATIAELWNTYLDAVFDEDFNGYLSSRDIAAMMILLKVARAANSTKCDHWVDIAGYAACGGEIDGTPEEETATAYADTKEAGTFVVQSLGGLSRPFELRFKAKKEDE